MNLSDGLRMYRRVILPRDEVLLRTVDEEYSQSVIRIIIVGIVGIALLIIATSTYILLAETKEDIVLASILAGCYWLFAILWWYLVKRYPSEFPIRRIFTIISDLSMTSFMLYQTGSTGAALCLLYFWIIVGNGMRFGPPYLIFSIGVGVIGFTLVMAFTEYWRQNLPLAGGLLVGIVVIPLYFLKLQNHVHLLNRRLARELKNKSKFLAAASHDLRQPLHALRLFVDTLDPHLQTTDARRIVNNMRSSAYALEGLFNALIDISKLDVGALKPQLVDFAIQPLLDEFYLEYAPQARDKNLNYRTAPCRAIVHSDPAMLGRILRNLISNAIRYTVAGKILVGCRRRPGKLRIGVWDTGIGIPSDQMEAIFQEFTQLSNLEHDRTKGLGLGLAIVDRLCVLLDHHVSVTSLLGKGSVFTVEVPIAQHVPAFEERPFHSNANHRGLNGAYVLVIDDEMLIQQAMAHILASWNCRALIVQSANEAVNRLTQEHRSPDAMLVDYRLKGTTGIEAIQEIRSRFKHRIPAVILTGDTSPERLREAKDKGYLLLHKPIQAAKLRTVLSYVIAQNRG